MLILALETATRAGSLALIGPGVRDAQAGDATRTHGVRLPRELFDFLERQGRTLADVDYLCVASGPGSFTGLRIGLATIQGIAMTSNKLVIPVPTLDALAAAWFDAHPARPSRLVACLDGARGDVFFAVFDAGDRQAFSVLIPASVGSPVEAAARIAALPPGDSGLLNINGDGTVRFRDVFSRELPQAVIDDAPVNLALGAAMLATSRVGDAVAPHALRPLYVRRPDAVLARERARTGEARPPLPLQFAPAKTPEALEAVAELQRRSFANAWGAEAIRWELDNLDVARMYTARNPAGDVVAYCACWVVFDELHINSVAVDATRRRQGIARRLLEHVLAEAAAGGARGATLEVRQSNEAARGLYEGLGFRVEGVRRNYYQNPREDALILWHRNLAGQFGRAER